MAERLVFSPVPDGCLVQEHKVQFQWFPGFSLSQKQRSIESLHRAAEADLGGPILEVSTKSPRRRGRRLSAFNLCVPLNGRRILLEAAFQGSKVFEGCDGPGESLYPLSSGREVKRLMRPYAASPLKEFRWNGAKWDLEPKTAFYDWLYLQALRDLTSADPDVDEWLREYEVFTDIEFNHKKSLNCQARSCALYAALLRREGRDWLDRVSDPDEFLGMLDERGYGAPDQEIPSATRPSSLLGGSTASSTA